MNIYYYDIWDGDKGVVIAKDLDEAKAEFKRNYPDIPFSSDVGYDSGVCSIDIVGECTDKPRLYFIEG